MCGITGLLNFNNKANKQLREICVRMTNTLTHRGPDDSGIWVDPDYVYALGHRRLSILDLSPEGHQPMISSCGRYVIVFNGEVFNFQSIRKELDAQTAAPVFRGHSDTEVMLAAISAWGLKQAVQKFIGMFAFALWDRNEQTLHLVRDRLGIKPLYYGWAGNCFIFGSELKALTAHPEFAKEISRDALALYFRHRYIPAPYSIYQGVFKLYPGHILSIRPGNPTAAVNTPVHSEPYWSARDIWKHGADNPWEGSDEEAVNTLENLLKDAVQLRMISDVPLGAFLSGGIDSSTVVALMQSLSARPVKTFTIGFYEDSFNEAHYAKKVADHLGTDHTELYLHERDALSIIPALPEMYDEPFADQSQMPTYLVSKLAKESVTVALSGDGGDELFSGYQHYLDAFRQWRTVQKVPYFVRSRVLPLIKKISPDTIDNFILPLNAVLVKLGLSKGNVKQRLYNFADRLSNQSFLLFYRDLLSNSTSPCSNVLYAQEPATIFSDAVNSEDSFDLYQLMSLVDLITYLPDDILVKVDRASMAVSLEARVPLLDHRVVEFAARIPTALKVRTGKGKLLLRQVLKRYIPEELIERPKAGFAVPVGSWLRNPLRQWAEEMLDEKKLSEQGFLNTHLVRSSWMEHLKGTHNWEAYLWEVLMFQAWLEQE